MKAKLVTWAQRAEAICYGCANDFAAVKINGKWEHPGLRPLKCAAQDERTLVEGHRPGLGSEPTSKWRR